MLGLEARCKCDVAAAPWGLGSTMLPELPTRLLVLPTLAAFGEWLACSEWVGLGSESRLVAVPLMRVSLRVLACRCSRFCTASPPLLSAPAAASAGDAARPAPCPCARMTWMR